MPMTDASEADRVRLPWGRPEAFLIVFLAWVVIYLPALGVPELHGEEGRRILPAVTMLQTGDWLVPRVAGVQYYQKPPMINWLVAASFLITGRQDDWSARLPSVLAILAFVTVLLWLPGDWPGTKTRLIAAVIFLTSFGVIKKGRRIEIEAVYISLTALATLTWLALWVRGRSRWALWLVPGVFLTCGMLTKGPPILLFYYAPLVCILAYARRLRALLSAPHLLSLVLVLGLPALSVYLAGRQAIGQGAVVHQLSETIARLTPTSIDWSRWATQAVRSFANPLPWLLFIPLLWRRDFVGRLPAVHLPLFQGARLGMVIAFMFITLIPGNSGRYSQPLLGLESLLLGWVLAQADPLPDEGRLWRRGALIAFGAAVILALVGLVGVRTDLWAFVLLVAAATLGSILFRWREYFRTPARLATLSALLGAVLMLEYALFVVPLMQRSEEHRPVAALLDAHLPPQEPLYACQTGFLDFAFYLQRPVEYLRDPSQIDNHVHFLLLRDPAPGQPQGGAANAASLGKTIYRFPVRRHGNFQLVERASN
jgi:4-amino-4-deoxy-L-arabinose transferase-like glycosyltransferase